MRTFVAIEVSDEIKSALGRIEKHLKYAGADVTWVNPEIMHFTLKFLGEVDEKKCVAVKRLLDAIANETQAFDLTIKDIGAFPTVDHPRVVWAGLDHGAAEMTALAKRIDESLEKLGFTREVRPFSPHMTIGRVRSSRNMEELKEKISTAPAQLLLYAPDSYRAASVILFQSTLTPRGPIHTKIYKSPLK